jgi:hypothetical protein
VWREGCSLERVGPLEQAAFRRAPVNRMAAQRYSVDLEGEQSPWKDRLREPTATSACSANSSMEQSLEVGCSTPSPVGVRCGNASTTSWKWRCATWMSVLRPGHSGASSVCHFVLRCVVVRGRENGAPVFLVQ